MMLRKIRAAALGCALALGTVGSGPNGAAAAEPKEVELTRAEREAFFVKDVWPILEDSCVKCHGSQRVKNGLRLDSRAAILRGGERGPAVSADNPKASLLLHAVSYRDENLEMPPIGKLADEKIAILSRWVRLGLPWKEGIGSTETAAPEAHAAPLVTPEAKNFWSFLPITRPATPQVASAEWPRNPIDHFVLAGLEARGIEPAKPAEKIALFRRVAFDLTGLPPTPEQTREFVADQRPTAYEDAVDRLLDSPQFGERWARHWLDLVRFGETHSFERDNRKPNAWRYRDYVIRSLNDDKPYNQFVLEQLAGDELDEPTADSITATAFYRLGPWDDEPTDRLQARYDEYDDVITTTGQAFLGLTVNCARCHDHKLDPIPQEDYYRLLAFFHNVTPTGRGRVDSIQADITSEMDREAIEREKVALAEQREDVRRQIEALESVVVSKLPKDLRVAAKDGDRRKRLITENLSKQLCKEELARYRELEEVEKRLAQRKVTKSDTKTLAVREEGTSAPETFVLVRGNAHVRGKKVEPGFPKVLGGDGPAEIPAPREGSATSGRRRVLAKWIASDRNPLTARVIVNRLWQHLFDRGIVASPNNFGRLGAPPTHPKLLDWLASELVAEGWSLKHVIRTIVTSSTYRMSSRAHAAGLTADIDNAHFWRQNMRRLAAEEIRDSILAINGTLNLKMGGPGIYTIIPREVLQGQSRPGSGWGKSSDEERSRRSVYIHVKRSLITPFLVTYDFADTDSSCPVRFTTTQPTQALTMLNSEFMQRETKRFAERLRREAPNRVADQVRRALELTLSRDARPEEIERGVDLIRDLTENEKLTPERALEMFALLALNLNEFLYLD